MSAAAKRLPASWLLLGEYGPTMKPIEFRGRFADGVKDRTYRDRIATGVYPAPRLLDGMFDTQEVGEWWDALPRRQL